MDKLIDTLRDRYDYIIVDNVPATMVADAMIVNRVADMIIYVVRQGNLTNGCYQKWSVCINRVN